MSNTPKSWRYICYLEILKETKGPWTYMVLRNPLRAFLHLRQQHGLAIRFYHLQLWWWYFSYASFFIMLHSSFIHLCFYGPPPYARRKTRGTNVLTRNQPEVDGFFLTLQWILSNVFSMSIKFIYQDDIHSKLCLLMLRQKNMLFVHHLGFFLNPFLSFLKMVSTSSFILSSTVLHSLFRYWE